MTITELFAHLHSLDVQLWVEADRLRVSAPKGVLTPELNSELAERKAELLAVLRRAQAPDETGAGSLQPAPRDQDLPASFAQQRLWFLDQLEPGNPAYNLAVAVQLRGRLVLDLLEQSAAEVVRRHEALRTTFVTVDGQLVQKIAPAAALPIPVVALQHLPQPARDAAIQAESRQEAGKPFDLVHGPLVRLRLLQVATEEQILLLTIHHIVADGVSIDIFVRELGAVYGARVRGESNPLAELPIQYADFAFWQRQWSQQAALQTQLTYWQRQLAGALPVLDLPTDTPRPAVQTFRGAKIRWHLPSRLAETLQALSRQERATIFMLMLAAFKILLYRYTRQTDIIVGTPMSGRNWRGTEELIGCFINNLALRTDLDGDPTFRELLARVRETATGAYAHQDYPFEKLVEELRPERDVSRPPFFQVMFLQVNAARPIQFGDLMIGGALLDNGASMFDLTMYLQDEVGTLGGNLEYNTDLYAPETMQHLVAHYQTLLEAIAADPDRRISALPILPPAEREQILVEWNRTQADYPRGQTLHGLFEAQASRRAESPAVAWEDRRLTYAQINRRANQLAHALRGQGVGSNVLVGLCLERTPDLLVALLGVLKAGGAYLPLDPAFPAERLAFMLDDAQVAVLVTESGLRAHLPETRAHLLNLDTDWESITGAQPETDPEALAAPSDLAYVIYTSGSTGQPKGVQITHRSVVNFLTSMQRRPGLSCEDILLAVTTLSFDIAVLELFLPLVTGGQVILAGRAVAADGAQLARTLAESGATAMQATPITWQMLLDAGWQGQTRLKALCGGEALSRALADRLLEKCTSVWNLYGPTETTVWSTAEEVQPGTGAVPIGRPIANTQLFLLDAQLQPVPIGVPGDLYIGGDGLSAGYLRRLELTAERFIFNPFSQAGQALQAQGAAPEAREALRTHPDAFLYSTGDLARYLANGTVEFLGRNDHQVKLRGLRIELGEIESVLAQHAAVRQAVVIVREDTPGDRRLVAYLIAQTEENPAGEALRPYLRRFLPDYMTPSAFVVLDRFPLTPNNKVDRRALPAPEPTRPELGDGFVPPRDGLESRIAQLWREVLKLEQVGIYDNFFDLGGHSLLLTQVHAKLRAQLGIDLSVIQLFQYPTVSALARHLSANGKEGAAPVGEAAQVQPTRAGVQGEISPGVTGERIAVVGLAGRFPKARDIDEFWQNLCAGVEGVTFFSDEELRAAGVQPALLDHPHYVKAKAILEDVEQFDAAFFGLNPKEAEVTDPQHRLFLECAWTALEHAGYASDRYAGAIGVFAGSSLNTYLLAHLAANFDALDAAAAYQVFVGNDKDFLPTRVSYKLNLRGPSVSIQTACSTSLVAVHHACQSLLQHECDMALAGGVSVGFPHTAGYLYQEGMILSPDGHCRAFDAEAKGTLAGEGVGIVVLKRLSDALADGDTVYAVIRGSAINNDGADKIGYTAPSITGQAEVIRAALANADAGPDTVSYIEAHGTGTPLGDPIEVAALTQVFHDDSDRKGVCALGSVKSNIGHLDAAAGVAGLIKTVLALHHKLLPPSLYFQSANPELDLAAGPFFVNTELRPWEANGRPRRAGVSSFGIGGTNAHVVLEEAPQPVSDPTTKPWRLVTLSARTPSALDRATANLAAHLAAREDQGLADVAYTLQTGRRAFEQRRIAVCRDAGDAAHTLQALDPQRVYNQAAGPKAPAVVFMFPGQGAQYVNMGRELADVEPVFRAQLDRCAELLQPYLGLDLRDLLYPASAEQADANEQLRQTSVAQPVLFAVEYALAQLWLSWGVWPQALIGHSIGEYVAATLAGVFDLEDALRLVAARGRLMQALPRGAMLAVSLGEQELQRMLNGHLTDPLPDYLKGHEVALAAVNSPALCVISGPVEAVERVRLELAAQQVGCHLLQTSHAFHSPMMEPALAPFAAELARATLHTPKIPFVSNVTGTWIGEGEATDPTYWLRHTRQAVRFGDGVRTLLDWDPSPILLEVGPGNTLGQLARRQPDRLPPGSVLGSLRHPREQQSDHALILTSLGRMWLRGLAVAWQRLYGNERRRRVSLPTYPFERQGYWVRPNPQLLTAAHRLNAGKRAAIAEWFYVPSWVREPPAKLDMQQTIADPLTWLVFCDRSGLGHGLIRRLAAAGRQVVAVEAGKQFQQKDEHAYVINPEEPEDYVMLLQSLAAQETLPDRIIHLWGVRAARRPAPALRWDEYSQQLGFYSTLYLAQALIRLELTRPLDFYVVTTGLHDVHGDEPLDPAHAPLFGLCRVIPQELPNLACRSIDLVLPTARAAQDPTRVDQLLVEFAMPSRNPVVAYRDAYRWVQTYEPARLAEVAREGIPLRQNGVYLITGGLGEISYALAAYLARTVAAKLVLTGRSALPPRDAWDAWLESHADDDRVSRRMRNVLALEAMGAEVAVIAADVADANQMQKAIEQVYQRFGALHGVIHAAGTVEMVMLSRLDRAACEAQFDAKGRGLVALAKLLHDKPLDFCLATSSLSTVLGGLGYGAYAAGNAYMDTFVRWLNRTHGTHWSVVNWDAWQQGVPSGAQAGLAGLAMTTPEGVETFIRVLANAPDSQVVVSTGDLAARLEQWVLTGKKPETEASPAVYAVETLRAHGQEYVAPRDGREEKLAAIWRELLGIEQVGVHDSFFDLGGSSLVAVRLFDRIERKFGRQLPAATLFDAPTIAQMATFLDDSEKPEQQVRKPSIGWSPLVPIQTHGTRPPLFFVHAAGGNVLTYRSLAHYLGPDQPVFGLQAQGLDGKQPLLATVEEMAALYLASIKTVQPVGPYLLGGYCMGGTVALEMAQQLRCQGEEVAFLALFETYNWHNMKLSTLPEISVATLQKLEFHLRNFLLLSATGKRTFLNEKLKVAQSRRRIWSGRLRARLGRLGGRHAIADLLSAKVWDHNDRVSLEYKPAPYAGTITHFRPKKEYACHSGADLRWERLAKHVETHRVQAYPAGMMVEPFVADLAIQVNACIACALQANAARPQTADRTMNGASEAKPVVLA